jgi:hypothetical protein
MATLSRSNVLTFIAGESLSARDCVFLTIDTAPFTFVSNITSGKVYKTRKAARHASTNALVVGFVVKGASADAPVQVQIYGAMAGFSGLTAGSSLQPADTSGALEVLEVHKSSGFPVAVASSTTEIQIKPPHWIVRGWGYIGGGYNGSSWVTVIEGLSFSDETISTMVAVMSVAKEGWSGNQSSSTAYYAGTYTASTVINTLSFRNGTNVASSSVLGTSRSYASGASSSVKGYVVGGTSIDSIEAITFSNDSVASITTLSTSRECPFVGTSTVKHYYAGSGTTFTNSIDAMPFSTESISTLSTTLTTGRNGAQGLSQRTKSYFSGGYSGSGQNFIEGFSFSDETISTLSSTLTGIRWSGCGNSSSLRGYICGGSTGTASNRVEQLEFSTEVVSLAVSNLTTARWGPGGTSS